jgi:hypothetical protein
MWNPIEPHPRRGSLLVAIFLAGVSWITASGVGAQVGSNQPSADEAALQQEVERARALDASEREHGPALRSGEAVVTATELLELRRVYHRARRVFGDDHVTLFPLAYARTERRCGTDCSWETGAAGAVMVPLLGWGGGHGLTGWPTLDTDDESEAYLRFERRARELSRALTELHATAAVPDTDEELEVHYRLVRDTFVEILERDVEERGVYDEHAKALWECVKDLDASEEPFASKLLQLDALWHQYELLYDVQEAKRRYVLLLGPLLALPLDQRPLSTVMWGAGLEVGGASWGITLGGGFYNDWGAGVPVGYWVGLGLSGALTSSVADGVTGASKLGDKL